MEMDIGGGNLRPGPIYYDIPEVAVRRLSLSPGCRTMVDFVGLDGARAAVLFADRLCSDSFQPRAHRPLLDRPDPLADQVYGPGRRGTVCGTHLSGQPIAAFLHAGYGVGLHQHSRTH